MKYLYVMGKLLILMFHFLKLHVIVLNFTMQLLLIVFLYAKKQP